MTTIESVLVTDAFSSWSVPECMVLPGHPTTNISFHRVPSSSLRRSHPNAGNPMRLFLRGGYISGGAGTYEF